ncbi:hypothetical protein BDW74DRAFT_160194 [Aspergillus multicolor]|uniref:uncharacterized protein n=1 Tax=Aspergillus multicolor TaxID=41759 RepID=UPI003CCCAFA1
MRGGSETCTMAGEHGAGRTELMARPRSVVHRPSLRRDRMTSLHLFWLVLVLHAGCWTLRWCWCWTPSPYAEASSGPDLAWAGTEWLGDERRGEKRKSW